MARVSTWLGCPILAGVLLAALPAQAQELAPGCEKDLAVVEDSFDETVARLQAAELADHTEKCAALHHHIDVMTNGRDVHLRCLPEGHDKGEDVAQLNASIEDFKMILGELHCE